MAISRLRVTAATLQLRVNQAAASSSNVVFVPPPDKRSMAGMMQYHEVLCCLREGRIVGKPVLTEAGLWEFHMERFFASQPHRLKVAAATSGARVTKLYAILSEA